MTEQGRAIGHEVPACEDCGEHHDGYGDCPAISPAQREYDDAFDAWLRDAQLRAIAAMDDQAEAESHG